MWTKSHFQKINLFLFFLIRRGIGFMNDLWNGQRQTQMEKHNCFHQLQIVFRDFFLFSKTNRPLIQRSSWHAIWEMSSTPLQYNTCLTCSFWFFSLFLEYPLLPQCCCSYSVMINVASGNFDGVDLSHRCDAIDLGLGENTRLVRYQSSWKLVWSLLAGLYAK